MFPNSNVVHSYSKVNVKKMLLGNNLSSHIIGFGDIQLKMFDGTIKTLSKVRHLPDLKRNLISIGIFDESGLTCKT